jgi:hypothetical protein
METWSHRRDQLEARLARPAGGETAMSELATSTRRDLDARPLGVRPEVPLTDAQRTALQRLQDYDLAPVRVRLLNQGVLPAEGVDDAIFEFRRFLGLVIVGYRGLPMVSAPVDEVWHTCLLFSRLYADLCEQTVGQFVHHEPRNAHDASTDDAEDDLRALDRFRLFQQAYARLYGETTAWLESGPPEEPSTAAGERADELAEVDLQRVVGGGSKVGGVSCDECHVIVKP